MEIAARLKGASKEYKTGDTIITALQSTSFVFMKKELTLIIGPSGSGKTTLLSLPGKHFAINIINNTFHHYKYLF